MIASQFYICIQIIELSIFNIFNHIYKISCSRTQANRCIFGGAKHHSVAKNRNVLDYIFVDFKISMILATIYFLHWNTKPMHVHSLFEYMLLFLFSRFVGGSVLPYCAKTKKCTSLSPVQPMLVHFWILVVLAVYFLIVVRFVLLLIGDH